MEVCMRTIGFRGLFALALGGAVVVVGAPMAAGQEVRAASPPVHLERPDAGSQPLPPAERPQGPKVRSIVARDGFVSVQVNVASTGANIPFDAANEPSIAVDPTAPNRMAVGWRQFDSIHSNFRQAGVGHSVDGGRTWTFPDVLDRGVFRSDPVLDVDAEGLFYYYSLYYDPPTDMLLCDTFQSLDGGRSWGAPIPAYGGDKAWVTIDRSGGIGHGNFYASWSIASGCCGARVFTRSTDRGLTYSDPIAFELSPTWGTLAVGPDGALYVAGNMNLFTDVFVVARSDNAQDPEATPTFEYFFVELGGEQLLAEGPNPVGLIGQVYLVADASEGPSRGDLYMLCSVDPPGSDPCDVHFVRSSDRGETWSEPVAVHTDERGAWQWFGTMSIAPNGRLDVVWVESLGSTTVNIGELHYASSDDGGASWSQSVPVSPTFDSHLGFPNQRKMGDYYHMVSDDVGAHLAYAATFNGEQDVYYLRIGDRDCNANGVGDSIDLENGDSTDCNHNQIPDSCEVAAGTVSDSDGDGVPDVCILAPSDLIWSVD
jgi:hypothetical protein